MKIKQAGAALAAMALAASCLVGCGSGGITGPKTYQVGETAEMKDLNIAVTEVEFTTYVSDGFDAYESDFGEQYILAAVSAENTGEEDIDIYTSQFVFYADETEAEPVSFYISGIKFQGLSYPCINETVKPGRKASFFVAAKIPDSCANVSIVFDDKAKYEMPNIKIEQGGAETGSAGNEGESAEPSAPEKQEVGIGEMLNNATYGVQINSVYQTDYIEDSGLWYYEPDPGYHYVVCNMEVVNNSEQTIRFDYHQRMDVFIDDYSGRFWGGDPTIDGVRAMGNQEYTDIYPGKGLQGYFAVIAPEGWQNIELTLRDGSIIIPADQVEIR